VTGHDAYGITAVLAVNGARALVAGRAQRSGVMTTAQAFDPREMLAELAAHGVRWRQDPL
jgi:hypothetical protein